MGSRGGEGVCEACIRPPKESPMAPIAPSLRVAAPLPDRAGTGFKPEHFDAILNERPAVGFFGRWKRASMSASVSARGSSEAVSDKGYFFRN